VSYQKITIVGNLGRDPEMRYTPTGDAVTSFSVATNRRWTNQDGSKSEETVWFRVTAWRKQAEIAAEYLKKGRQVMVEGRITPDKDTGGPRVWTGQDGVARSSYEVTAQNIVFLSGGNGQSDDAGTQEQPTQRTSINNDDLPF
jgi:single-strand DNA-binding protein